ncbi:hypothetical protein [Lactobacillus intestinalis]|nr:hypothetical protein [Lactobacillus intestinalis]
MENNKDENRELKREQRIKSLTYSRAFSVIYWVDFALADST